MRYVPQWFPLAYFQRYAAKAKPIVHESVNKPFEETKRHMVDHRSVDLGILLNVTYRN